MANARNPTTKDLDINKQDLKTTANTTPQKKKKFNFLNVLIFQLKKKTNNKTVNGGKMI